MSRESQGRKRRDWVEHIDQTLPGAHTPNLRLQWPRPSRADTPSTRREIDDADVQRVRQRVLSDLLVFPPDLRVRAHEGVLVLEGRASTPQEHKRIEVLAREVVGDAVIDNRMMVGY